MSVTKGLLYSYYLYIYNSNAELIDDIVEDNFVISQDKTKLYSDFICDLLKKIHFTFLGDDVMGSQDDYLEHYRWCLDEVTKEYVSNGVMFDLDPLLNNYIYLLICENYYYMSEKSDEIVDKLYTFFQNILNNNTDKSKFEGRLFEMLYILFDRSLI